MRVAPYVGAWIETPNTATHSPSPLSHPTWVRGLKQERSTQQTSVYRRTLRGCVD